MEWTGGCLCSAIRYCADARPAWASYCHCAMCRKATGAPFAGFVEFPRTSLLWQGDPARVYSSSPGVVRRFCGTCGSSLTFEADGVLFLTLGSLDHPDRVEMKCHSYIASKLPGVVLADDLPHFDGPVGGKGGRPVAG